MGVRGLTTYVATYSDRYLVPYELKNCTLVIDGNSLVALLYNWHSNCVSTFGGDYDKYAKCVSKFFLNLKKCRVSALVIFDGGYESKKLRTVMSRLRKKISLAKHVSPTSKENFFPLLLKEVFKDVLLDLCIPFAQCFFEADDEIAAIARILNCPVLSYDSDFFVYDVMYIPFSTVHIDVSSRKNGSNKCTDFFLNCSIYHVENFLNHFGGLHKSLIPLMATLLGNDYISRNVFKNFFSSYLKLQKIHSISNTQKYIGALLNWMKTETLETATLKVLSTLKAKHRRIIKSKIKLTIKGYTQCSSELLPYLGMSTGCSSDLKSTQNTNSSYFMDCTKMESSDTNTLPNTVTHKENLGDENLVETRLEVSDSDCSFSRPTSSCSSQENEIPESDVTVDNECTVEFQSATLVPSNIIENLPLWFKDKFLKGHLPPYFMDMIQRNTYFCSPQVEDYNCPFAHLISFPIIYAIYRLLKTDSNMVPDVPLICYGRNSNHQPEKFRLTSEMITSQYFSYPLPSLATLIDLPLQRRKSVLFDTLGFGCDDCEILGSIPEDWAIFIFAVVYWGRHCTQPSISNCHIHALLLGLVALNIVDRHTGYYRSKATFSKALGSKLVKIKESRKRNRPTKRYINEETNSRPPSSCLSEMNITNLLDTVTTEECILVNEALLSFHQMNDRLKDQPKLYTVTTVHAFAQFQSCLLHIISLNCLLNFPFQQCKTAHFYSGMFTYNTYASLKKCTDVDVNIESVLKGRSTIHNLYKSLYCIMQRLLPGLHIVRKKKKLKSLRSNTSECLENDEEQTSHSVTNVEEDALYEDSNNKFSVLGQIADTESENSK